MKLVAATLVARLPLSACAEAETPNAKPARAVASEPKISPSIPVNVKEAYRRPVDLTPYIGKYPFEVVVGHRFLDHPAVKAAIAAAVAGPDARAQVVFADNVLGVPIVRVTGGRILTWRGARRAEDRYNRAVVIAPEGMKGEVCIFEAVVDDPELWFATWHIPGQSPAMKQGDCPSAAEDYPAAEIAAG